jgi:hypothetical protein
MTKCKACGQDLPQQEKKVKMPKVKVFKGSEDKWLKMAANLAFSYCPTIYECKRCHYPVVDGYVCHYCGSETPGSAENGDLMLGFDVEDA